MEPLQFVAILDRSAGNNSVREIWQETKIFDSDTRLLDVLAWATQRHEHGSRQLELFRGNLKLTVAQ